MHAEIAERWKKKSHNQSGEMVIINHVALYLLFV